MDFHVHGGRLDRLQGTRDPLLGSCRRDSASGRGFSAGRAGDAFRTERDHTRLYRSEEHTSELQSQSNLVCRLLLEKKKKQINRYLEVQAHLIGHIIARPSERNSKESVVQSRYITAHHCTSADDFLTVVALLELALS